MDRRRRNKSIEQRQINIQRLKEYRSKLILFPINEKRKLRKGEATPEERKVTQLKGTVMPIRNAKPVVSVRAMTSREKKFGAFLTMKKARSDARLVGIRAKKAKEASENPDDVTKVQAAAPVKKGKKWTRTTTSLIALKSNKRNWKCYNGVFGVLCWNSLSFAGKLSLSWQLSAVNRRIKPFKL